MPIWEATQPSEAQDIYITSQKADQDGMLVPPTS